MDDISKEAVACAPKKHSGFAIKSWSDIGVIVLIFTFIVSGLVWGMKLEGRYDKLDAAYVSLAKQVGTGILPRAEERIHALEEKNKTYDSIMLRMEERLSRHGVNGTYHND